MEFAVKRARPTHAAVASPSLLDGVPAGLETEAWIVARCAAGATGTLEPLLESPIHWDALASLAERHGVRPLVFEAVLKQFSDRVPAAVGDQWGQYILRNVACNLALTGELVRVVRGMEAAGIAVLAYKGPVLAQELCGSIGLREIHDLDLIVPEAAVPAAREVLTGLGYHDADRFTPDQLDAWLRSSSEIGMARRDGQDYFVDLHWGFTSPDFPFRLDPGAVLARSRRVSIGGKELPTLAPEDLLIALCIHGANHQWARLSWIGDIVRLIEAHAGLDWDAVEREATTADCRHLVDLGLALAGELGAPPVPTGILTRARESSTCQDLMRRVHSVLWLDFQRTPVTMTQFQLAAMPRIYDRARSVWRLAVTPTRSDWGTLTTPRGWYFLYYLVRPLRLIRDCVTGATRRRWTRRTS